jgi:peptidyl-prolyl cis-trans isomerase C
VPIEETQNQPGRRYILTDRLRALLREPLVHFLIAGAALFGFNAWRGTVVDPAERRIVVSEAQVKQLAAIWSQSWQRPPTPSEIDGLIRDYIKEEVYAREAIRLGLGDNDPVIRRRLRTKMETLAVAQTETTTPDDATLQKWMDTHPARYLADPLLSFDQAYVGDADAATVARWLADYRQNGKTALPRPAVPLPNAIDKASATEINRTFGEGFAAAVAVLPLGVWSGPVESGFGQHIVRLRAAVSAHKALLSEVRQQAENDWRAETGKAREAAAYQALLDGYDVRIERPR